MLLISNKKIPNQTKLHSIDGSISYLIAKNVRSTLHPKVHVSCTRCLHQLLTCLQTDNSFEHIQTFAGKSGEEKRGGRVQGSIMSVKDPSICIPGKTPRAIKSNNMHESYKCKGTVLKEVQCIAFICRKSLQRVRQQETICFMEGKLAFEPQDRRISL